LELESIGGKPNRQRGLQCLTAGKAKFNLSQAESLKALPSAPEPLLIALLLRSLID